MHIDTEGMRRAASEMNAAAENMNQAARNMDGVVDRLERVLGQAIGELSDTLHNDRQARS
jgi:hypothetical protein